MRRAVQLQRLEVRCGRLLSGQVGCLVCNALLILEDAGQPVVESRHLVIMPRRPLAG